ncbi:citryl-CoA lyase [Nonomuraea africana]|uniref:citrate synthase (unknown stereospecificity) n=1 Tax=Nonomuraea africana TaxID=46171 RepID=A0ABR9KDL3_9ACTN|nr:citryl-CoA lyase [Nonomuraea africana]MBE1560109.1 citrate synthase [Nonomuraea africana]
MSRYRTSIGSSDENTITLLGHDLSGELMGRVGFGELVFWLVAMRRPTPGELRLFEAVLMALADHGFTPAAITARLTLTSAPESYQGALSAGLLGGGSRFRGAAEDCARFLSHALAEGLDAPEAVAARRHIPGLGHPVHTNGDPRTPVIYQIAREEGLYGKHMRFLEEVAACRPDESINGAGACGAALADLGFPVEVMRGFALLACTAGLLGHLAEEQRRPIGPDIYRDIEQSADYLDPEEQVEVPVGHGEGAAHGAGVAPAERGGHHAPRVELDDRG